MTCLSGHCRSPIACGGFGYCRELNTMGCHTLAVAAIREQLVRAGRAVPINAGERRQAIEGPVPANQLDAVTCARN